MKRENKMSTGQKRKVHFQRVMAMLLTVIFIMQPMYVRADDISGTAFGESGQMTETAADISVEPVVSGDNDTDETAESYAAAEETAESYAAAEDTEESEEMGTDGTTDIDYSLPSDGSYGGRSLKFVNLYWETNDLGDIEAVFDGGSSGQTVQVMDRGERGIYETVIPSGDYSRVAFKTAGTENMLGDTAYNIYGVGDVSADWAAAPAKAVLSSAAAEQTEAGLTTEAVDFEDVEKNTFYYDIGDNPSYWGADPAAAADEVIPYSDSHYPGEDYEAVTNPGDMVYVIDMAKVERPDDTSAHAADRINIKFMKHLNIEEPIEVTYTMYEQRDGIYTAPFPENANDFEEFHFQLVGNEEIGEDGWLPRHYNFRGDASGESDELGAKWGHFKYLSGYMDAFYLNLYRDEEHRDASFWGTHPSRADDALDTEVLYFDVTDYTQNGTIADEDNMWLSWNGMSERLVQGAQYDPQKGYKVSNKLAQEHYSYFQFPYNSRVTENTVLTLTFTLKDDPSKTEYTYKFMYVPRGGRNHLRVDNIWEFNGQMWTHYIVGDVESRTIFFRNKMTDYKDGTVYMRIADEDGNYAERETLRSVLAAAGYEDSEIEDHIVEKSSGDTKTWWLKMDKVEEPNAYNKTNIYSMEVPSPYKYVQFCGTKDNKIYYSNKEEISTEFSYPCFYAHQTGGAASQVPDGDASAEGAPSPGITGFWRSIYSADTTGDETVEIPTDTFVREEDAYYGSSTFYDYYSNWEMNGIKLSDPMLKKTTEDDYQKQGSMIKDVLAQYYQDRLKELGATEAQISQFKPLYLTTNSNDKWWNGGHPGNKWTGNNGGPAMGLADKTLTDGQITIGKASDFPGVEMPFFNEDFLRGNNRLEMAVGNVYKNVLFPFTKDTDVKSRTYGYWVFNSAKADDAMRLSYDVDEGYFLKRTKEPLQFRNRYSFYPFNGRDNELFDNGYIIGDKGGTNNSKANVNCMFGMQFSVDFTLTDNGEIYNEYTQKDEPIRFEFQGDDDAWIYIDGILALDLGGVHDAVRGEINFKENTYTIWRALKSGNTYEGDGTVFQTGALDPELVEVLKDQSKTHTLTMFYMERGLYESNLKLSFNFPRQSTFEVEKEVDITSNETQGQENIFTDLLLDMGGFNFEIENLVTSGDTVEVEDSSGYMKPGKNKILYNQNYQALFVMTDEAGVISGENPKEIVQQAIVSGAVPEEKNLLKIKPDNPMDLSDMSYMRLQMKNMGANDTSARNLYLSFVDGSGRRVGRYANRLGYEGEANSFMTNENSVLRIDFRQMRGDAGFDWSDVDYMLVGIRRTSPEDSAHYQVSSVAFFESLNQTSAEGFSVTDDQISDYGSYEAGRLMPVDQAWYTRHTKTDGTYDAGVSRQTDEGQFALADGQKAIFSDKFRTGSYIGVKETNVNPKIFDTQWTMLENGVPVEERHLLNTRDDIESVINPLTFVGDGVLDGIGTEIGDGRQEILDEKWPKFNSFKHPDLNKTLVYRSYINPDTTANVSTDIGVHVKNTLKYGSLTITKQLTDNMKYPGTDRYKTGDYIFDVYFTNVAGMGLESQLAPVNGNERYVLETVTVHVDETGRGQTTLYNIPAGTSYHIVERPSNGAILVDIDLGVPAAYNPHENLMITNEAGQEHGTPDFDYKTAYVEGTAYASNQEVIYTNNKEPFYMEIEKVWEDGLTDEQRPIEKVYIRLERSIESDIPDEQRDWEVVTMDFFDEAIVDSEGYIVLEKAYGWKLTSKEILPIENDQGQPYDYRIREIDKDGNLKSYEVTYTESNNGEENGTPVITYKAVNSSAGVTVEKIWEDNENIGGIRPIKIRAKLVGSTDKAAAEADWICHKKLLNEKHNCDDGCYIELSKDNGWRAAADNLMLTDDADVPYYYRLSGEQIYTPDGRWVDVGTDNSDYTVTYGEPQQPHSGEAVTLTMSNGLEFGNITIRKKDAKDDTKVLPDAEFKIERLVTGDEGKEEEWAVDQAFAPRTAVTSATGTIEFKNLPYGTYRITEIKAPTGYIILKKPVHVTLSDKAFEDQAQQHADDLEYDPADKTITVTIKNEKGLRIPLTGGRGIYLFAIVGIAFCGAAALLYIYRLKSLRRTHHRSKK